MSLLVAAVHLASLPLAPPLPSPGPPMAAGTGGFCAVPVLGGVCKVPATVGSTVAGSAVSTMAEALTTGFVRILEVLTSWWTTGAGTSASLTASNSITTKLTAVTTPLTWATATCGVMIAGTRMALSSSRAQEPARDLLRGLIILGFLGAFSGAIVQELRAAVDGTAADLVNQSLTQSSTTLAKVLAGLVPLQPGLMFLLGLIGTLSGLVQFVIMLFREPVLAILTGILPIAAGAAMTGTGMTWLKRLVGWITSFLLYKLVAAVIYYAAFTAILQANDLQGVILAITLIIIAVVALPAMIRLITPVVVDAGGGGGALAAAAGTAAMGALLLPSRGGGGAGSESSSPPTGTGGGAGLQPAGAGVSSGLAALPGALTAIGRSAPDSPGSSPSGGSPSGGGGGSGGAPGQGPPPGAGGGGGVAETAGPAAATGAGSAAASAPPVAAAMAATQVIAAGARALKDTADGAMDSQ